MFYVAPAIQRSATHTGQSWISFALALMLSLPSAPNGGDYEEGGGFVPNQGATRKVSVVFA